MTSEDSEEAVLRLRPVLDLSAAAPLAGELTELRGHPLRIDASAAERLGGLCLQILLSCKATWAADRLPFALVNPSPAFEAGAAQLGAPLERWFENVEFQS